MTAFGPIGRAEATVWLVATLLVCAQVLHDFGQVVAAWTG